MTTMYQDRHHRWVYLFAERSDDAKKLLGGKGAGLADMTHAGLPVPPGFVITTEACNAYYAYDRQFPEGMWTQAREALDNIEARVGKRFGDKENPLLVSVRSGAFVSMPGMSVAAPASALTSTRRMTHRWPATSKPKAPA
jgi:pyruvate, orthophosphate dikinase